MNEQLDGVAALPCWGADEPENEYNLPSFSAYPQVTHERPPTDVGLACRTR